MNRGVIVIYQLSQIRRLPVSIVTLHNLQINMVSSLLRHASSFWITGLSLDALKLATLALPPLGTSSAKAKNAARSSKLRPYKCTSNLKFQKTRGKNVKHTRIFSNLSLC